MSRVRDDERQESKPLNDVSNPTIENSNNSCCGCITNNPKKATAIICVVVILVVIVSVLFAIWSIKFQTPRLPKNISIKYRSENGSRDQNETTAENMDLFLGSWLHEKSENFDEYLTARGVPWIARQMIQLAWVTKTFIENDSDGSYTLINDSSMKTIKWTFKLNETFEGTGFDGKKRLIRFDCTNNTLYEMHIKIEDNDKKPDTFRYIRDGDFIIVHLETKGITARRFFRKQI